METFDLVVSDVPDTNRQVRAVGVGALKEEGDEREEEYSNPD